MDLKTNLIRTYYPSIPSRINMGTDFNPIKIEEAGIEGLNNQTIEDFNKHTIETLIEQFLTLPLPSNGQTSYNSTLMQKDLEHLNRKLSAIRKTITAWDTYKITEVVVEKELLAGKIQGLPLNSSLVVNTSEPVYLNGKTYQLGDIVFKDISGNLHQIKSSPSGFFYPSNIQKTGSDSNTIQIDYSFFAGSQPSLPEQTIDQDNNKPITEPGHTIKTTLTLSEDTNFYNKSDFIAPREKVTDITKIENVLPKVFTYLCEGESILEEIYIDNILTVSDTITIENPTTFTIKYIMR